MPTPKAGYTIDGQKVPSVTTVLKAAQTMPSDALCGWAAKLARQGKDWYEERERAGAIGTYIHGVIEAFPAAPDLDAALDRYRKPLSLSAEERARVMRAFDAHVHWVVTWHPRIVIQEVQLTSRVMRVGGTPDLVVDLDEPMTLPAEPDHVTTVVTTVLPGRYLVDHKTGKTMGVKEVMQTAGYAELLRECLGIEVDGALIMHHSPEAPFRVIPVSKSDLVAGLEAFRLVRSLYDLLARLAPVIPQPKRPWQPRRAA